MVTFGPGHLGLADWRYRSRRRYLIKDDQLVFRPARTGDGPAVFDVTRFSAAGRAKDHCSQEPIANWMGELAPDFYEDAIAKGRIVGSRLPAHQLH
jgi:hypothetical protein